MSRLYMRTSDEAHVYMDQRPCTCGDIEFARQSAVMTDGDVLCSRYFGGCRTCRTMREFIFELPKVQRPIGNQVEFGGGDPSRLLDAGEWMGISEYYAKLDPGTPDDLDIARAALEEVIKFLPDGAESVPADSFWTERGRAVRDREPGRFRRARLAAVLDVYRKLLAKQDLTQIAVAWKHTGDAELPYTADVRGRRFTIRINDFPAEPLYTLMAEGNELQDLEDWPPAWVKPAPPKELLALLVPKSPTCSLCGSIPDVASANTGRDDHFGPPITSLKRNGIASDDDLWECPECDAVFLWHDYAAQTGSGNNDEEVLTRLPSPQASFLRSFLHRGERRAEDAAQDARRLVDLPGGARDLVLSHLLRHDRELAARLVPWMIDEIGRGNHASLAWADAFVRSFASGQDAARVMSELSARPPSPALEKLRAHCKREVCSICRTIVNYPPTIARRDRPPAPLDSLVQLGASDEVDLWECPECDSMFMWESKDGNEGSVRRQSEPLASAFRACVHRTGVVADSDVEMVFACAASKVVLAHGMRRDRELVRQLVPRMVSALALHEQPWMRAILSAFVEGEERVQDVDPVENWDAFESALAKMTSDEAWKDLEKVIRRALRVITGFAGPPIGARAKADVEHDLWKRLGLLYSDRLDAKESALTALEMAVKLRADDDETQLTLAALHEQAGRFEHAIRCNEIAVRTNPKRIDGYRNLFRLHTHQGAHDAAWCAASAIAFLDHPGPEVDFYARHGSPAAPPFTGTLEETSWLLLRHEDESDVITNVFRVLAPAAARLAKAENRAGSAAPRWFGPTSGIGPGELAFMAGRNAAYGRAPLRSLFSDHGAISEIEDLFMAGLRAVWLDAWRSPPVFGERAVERAADLARFLEPAELVALRTSVTPVRKQGLVDIVKWASGVELTAARAGLLFSGDLMTAERALRHLADLGGLSVEEKMLDLLAFSASESYVALRKTLGRAIDIAASDKPSDEPRARTLVEMRFAASLRPCATCGAPPPENLALHGSDDCWSLVGKCLYCGADRRFDFFTEGDPMKGEYARRELGDARASQVIRAHEFLAELERLSPLVAEEPRRQRPAEWRSSMRAVDRAITCVLELLKLVPESATRAWLTAERDRLLAIHVRLRAEVPRIWELEGRRLGLADEIRGLLNQVSKQRLPVAADLREYFASRKVRSLMTAGPDLVRPPWATKVNGADDVFVELDSDCVTGVHFWDDSGGFGAYAEVYVRKGELEDVKDGMLHVGSDPLPSMKRVAGLPGVTAYLVVEGRGVRLSAEHEDDGAAVKVVSFLFQRV